MINHFSINILSVIQNSSTDTPLSQINCFQAIVFGFIQGLTEFLPISSTAHLKVIPEILWNHDPGVDFTAVIQLGSIFAVVSYFWQDLKQVCQGSLKAIQTQDYHSKDFQIAKGIFFGTFPILIIGAILEIFQIDLDNSVRGMMIIAIASIVMALFLALAEKISQHLRNFDHLKLSDALMMGLAQSLAIIPGVSRSGSTITAGLFMGLDRASAARFSFLLGIPAITCAGLIKLKDVFGASFTINEILILIVGVISSAFFSYMAIAWLIKYLQKKDTWIFVWYRLGFGVFILIHELAFRS